MCCTRKVAAVDCAGVHSASAAAAGVLFGALGALLVEQIDYKPAVSLVSWAWAWTMGCEHAVFSKNRDRLLSPRAQRFFAEVNRQAKKFMSDEHFTVDGTLIQAWAAQKSFRPKDGDGPGDGDELPWPEAE